MRHLFAPAALAVAAALSLVPALAFAGDEGELDTADRTVGEPLGIDTVFDLGIDVTAVPKTPAAVRAFLLGLAPDTQNILVTTCAHYVTNPESIQSRETLEFCRNAVSG